MAYPSPMALDPTSFDENHSYKKYSTATQLKDHTAVQAILKAKY